MMVVHDPADHERGTSVTLLGTLLRNRRPDERNHAWNQPNLRAPETLEVTSSDVADGGSLPRRHAGRRVGGQNVSPQLAWSEPPAGTVELLLVVEDLDAPLGAYPPVHCLALVSPTARPTAHELPAGALARKAPTPEVTLLRSTIGRGYLGPEPVKGHGPHRYVFQVFALEASLLARPDAGALLRSRPRRVLAAVDVPVLARGRLTATYER